MMGREPKTGVAGRTGKALATGKKPQQTVREKLWERQRTVFACAAGLGPLRQPRLTGRRAWELTNLDSTATAAVQANASVGQALACS